MSVPALALLRDSTLVPGVLIDSMTLELAPTDTARWIEWGIWSDGAVAGGAALLEIVTDLALDGREVAATELLVGDDLVGSAIPWYTPNGDLKYRQIELAFCGVVGTGGCSFPASLQEISSGEATDSLMLRDTEASNHGLHLVWGIVEEKVDGWNALSGEPPPTCIIGGPGWCVEPPPFDSGHISDTGPTGTIRVRAYLPEVPDAELLLSADTTELHPAVTAVDPVNSGVQPVRDGDVATLSVMVNDGGLPATGTTVSFRAEVLEQTGGHAHYSVRHSLTEFPEVDPGEGRVDPNLWGTAVAGHFRKGAVRVDSIEVVADSTGVATVEFVAGFLGGAVEVIAVADVGTITLTDTILIELKVPGLVALDSVVSNAYFVGGTGGTGHLQRSNWYVRSEVVDSLQAIATALQTTIGGTDAYIQLNDASLPRGGSFTANVSGLTPITGSSATVDDPLISHRSHGLGVDVDVAFCYALDSGVDLNQENRVGWDNAVGCIDPATGQGDPDLELNRARALTIMGAHGDVALHAPGPNANHFHIRFWGIS